MKKTLFLTYFALISSIMSFAQSPIWVVGNQYMPSNDFNPNPLPTPPNGYQGQPAVFTSNAYHNPVTGELLFFVVDEIVYDKDGYIINWMQLPSAAFCKGESEIAIVPDPSSCSRYYIISSTRVQHPFGGLLNLPPLRWSCTPAEFLETKISFANISIQLLLRTKIP